MKVMHKLLLMLSLCISLSATAQDFKILFVNTGTIRVGGKELKAGDVFNQDETIQWTEPKQAMKVQSLTDKQRYIFVSEDFSDHKMKSAKDYLVKSNRLSTRGSGSLSSVGRKMSDTIYVMDEEMIPIDYVPDESEYFFVTNGAGRFVLDFQDKHLLISPEIWADNEPVEVDLFYHYADGEEECVKEAIQIIPLPKELKQRKKRFLFF